MADKLISAQRDSSGPIASGGSIHVTINYSAEDGGTMDISYTDGFSGSPGSAKLAATAAGVKRVKLTIRRTSAKPGDRCVVRFTFVNQRVVWVEVN